MQPSSRSEHLWRRSPWCAMARRANYCLAALVLALGLAPVQAASESCQPAEQSSDTGPQTFAEPKNNPCNGDEIAFQGTTRTETRDRIKGDCSVEMRSRLRTDAKGLGATLTEYKLQEDFASVVRFGGKRPEQLIDRKDQRIIAQKAGITDEAASWFFTERTQSTTNADGTRTQTNTRTRCRCKRDDEPTPSPSCEPA